MSDTFHEDVSFEFVAAIFGVMAASPQHCFQVLTKRPERMLEWFEWIDNYQVEGGGFPFHVDACFNFAKSYGVPEKYRPKSFEWPLENVQLGVTVENQRAAMARIPLLLKCPASVRFLSCEPLLHPLIIGHGGYEETNRWTWLNDGGLHYVVVGGESGPNARPMHPGWAYSIMCQCQYANVPFFMKQLGTVWAKENRSKTAKGEDMSEWPEDLRIREMPR
jgi:protein gp37